VSEPGLSSPMVGSPVVGSPVISVVVADDHEVVRAGFAALLDTQPDFTVLGTAANGAEAVAACRALGPDVVLMDVRMPGTDVDRGDQAARRGRGRRCRGQRGRGSGRRGRRGPGCAPPKVLIS